MVATPSYYSSIVTISLGGTAVKAIKVSKTVLPNRNGCEDIYRAAFVILTQLKTATLSCVTANKPVQIVFTAQLYTCLSVHPSQVRVLWKWLNKSNWFLARELPLT